MHDNPEATPHEREPAQERRHQKEGATGAPGHEGRPDGQADQAGVAE